ncbi:MAG TPA: acetate--CoA ligase family protein, partial [Gemmobacter sp.]|nr:acetate--CoA ligase family protein [Gemmobacter sp.]
AEGKALLAEAGVAVPRSVTARALTDLRADGLVPPFALKGLGFAHKTEAGAVRLGLQSLDGQAEMPGATGYLLEEMVTGIAAEMLLGLRRDPVYGVTLTLGMGGVTAEVLADTVTLVWPVSEAEIIAALRRLRLWPLLDGYRGRPRADVAALAAMAVRLGKVMAEDARLEEIEINPVMLRAEGAVAVDALIRRAE